MAELELGAPGRDVVTRDSPGEGSRLGWYSRGYLPHRDEVGLLQSLTFRLADSLPQDKLRQLERELAPEPKAMQDVERRKRLERWLDVGMGCCTLAHPRMAETMENAMLHFDGQRYRVLAWCIMPNHVHALIEPVAPLGGIVQSWKSFTGRWALAHSAELGLNTPERSFWMREYWDRYIRDGKHLRQVIEYIHQNPVKAGLCPSPQAWPWSSARFEAAE
ncbi:MAG TPA: transposase [Thermoanaerobaculia bacterium]|nr:transposase [Thermoanaerobaculia bacterium]